MENLESVWRAQRGDLATLLNGRHFRNNSTQLTLYTRRAQHNETVTASNSEIKFANLKAKRLVDQGAAMVSKTNYFSERSTTADPKITDTRVHNTAKSHMRITPQLPQKQSAISERHTGRTGHSPLQILLLSCCHC